MRDPDRRTQRHDDQLLDRLGRGEWIEPRDDVEAMLSAWRQDLPAAGPPDPVLLAAVTAPAVRPKRRMSRASLGIAASVAVLSGGVMAGAAYAKPDSPLWPVTRFVYGNLAESRMALNEADHALAAARTAAAQGHPADAARLLTTASRLAAQVDEPADAQRLRAAIAELRDELRTGTRTTAGPAGAKPTESLGVAPPPPGPGDPPGPTGGEPGPRDGGPHPGPQPGADDHHDEPGGDPNRNNDHDHHDRHHDGVDGGEPGGEQDRPFEPNRPR